VCRINIQEYYCLRGANSRVRVRVFSMRIVQLTTDARDFCRDYSAAIPYFGTPAEALLQGFVRFPDIEVHVVSCTHKRMVSPSKLADNVWFHSVYVPKWGWMRTLYAGCILPVRKKIREIRPDIVHGQGTEKDCAISAVLSGFPNVITLHGIMQEQAKLLKARPGSFYWLANKLETFALRRTQGVFSNSNYTETLTRPRAKKTWRVANPVREPFFKELPTVIPPPKPILLNIGNVCARKRQNELLEAFSGWDSKETPYDLHFIGDASRENPYGKRFLDLVEKNQSFARYVGFKPTGALLEYLDHASALVHVPAEETFGLVVAEALARNLKFFGFRVGGIADIATGVDGVELFDDGDWVGLNQAIAKWIREGCPRPTSAAKTMGERYHPDVIAARHLQIYREVLNTCS